MNVYNTLRHKTGNLNNQLLDNKISHFVYDAENKS